MDGDVLASEGGGKYRQFMIYAISDSAPEPRLFSDRYQGIGSRLSPKGNYVSFFGTSDLNEKLFKESVGWSKALKLLLFRTNGEYLRAFDIPVASYQWAPDEKSIVYLTSSGYREMKNDLVTGAWILSIEDGKEKQISDCQCAVRWASFDGNIYLRTEDYRAVFKYDPHSLTLEETKYKDIEFSQSGKYYMSPGGGEGGVFRLYITRTNEDISARVRSVMSNHLRGVTKDWNPSIAPLWTGRDQIIFPEERYTGERPNFLFDVTSNTVVKSFDGHYLGLDQADSGKALILRRGAIQTQRINN